MNTSRKAAVLPLLLGASLLVVPVLATPGLASPLVTASERDSAPAITLTVDPNGDLGAKPGMWWQQRNTLRNRAGTVITLDRYYNGAYKLGNRIHAVRYDNEGRQFYSLLNARGQTIRSQRTSGLKLNVNRSNLVWMSRDGRVHTAWKGGSADLATQARGARPVGIAGTGSCLEAANPAGCAVGFSKERGRHGYTVSHGFTEYVKGLRMTAYNGRYWSMMTSVSDEGSCSAVYQDARVSWKTCTTIPTGFSADNRYVIATDGYLDGIGPGRYFVLDADTGATVATLNSRRKDYLADAVWEDNDTVLVTVKRVNGNATTVVRVNVDGTQDVALPTMRLKNLYRSAYRLPSLW